MVAASVEASLLAHAQRLLRGRPWARGELAAKLAAVCHRRRGSARAPTAALFARAAVEGPFDAVIHFAALKAVGESVAQPLAYYENNIAVG